MTDPIELSEDTGSEKGGAPRTRAAARSASPRQTPTRGATGRIEVRGRNGEILTRAVTGVRDEFELPEQMKDPEYDYQWVAVSVSGDTDVCLNIVQEMEANGWRAVPASRFPGKFVRGNTKGDAAIVKKGQMLMERPLMLSQEARNEEYAKAYQQMRDRDEALVGRKANLRNSVGDGFQLRQDTNYKGRRTGMSIDQAYDIPKPNHQIAEPGE